MKNIKEISDQELKEAYEAGKLWVSNRCQVVGTNKNVLGESYNNDLFLVGLKRLEAIEDELREREIVI